MKIAKVTVLFLVVLLICTFSSSAKTLERWLQSNQLGTYYSTEQDWDAIEDAAKNEGKVVVYSSSSRIDTAASHFMELYPEITVEAYPLGSAETIDKVIREMEAGLYVVDVVTTGGMADIKYELLDNDYLFNFVPSTYVDEIPEEYQWPLLYRIGEARVALYNTERYPDGSPISSLWDYTKPEWSGNIAMADPMASTTTFLQIATIVQQHDFMAAEYEEVFGEPLVLSQGIENAGYEWLYRFLKNDPVIISSSTRMREAIGASGQSNPPIGFDCLTALRYNEANNFKIGVADEVPGVIYPTYMAIGRQAPNPNAAKLFIRYLLGTPELTSLSSADLSEPYTQGTSRDRLGGLAGWFDPGAFSPRNGAPLHPLAERYWSAMTFWLEDGDFVWTEGPRIMEFWMMNN